MGRCDVRDFKHFQSSSSSDGLRHLEAVLLAEIQTRVYPNAGAIQSKVMEHQEFICSLTPAECSDLHCLHVASSRHSLADDSQCKLAYNFQGGQLGRDDQLPFRHRSSASGR